MPTRRSPRRGSLQFWPRKKASKFLPRTNWNSIPSDSVKNIKGFICYKAGMFSAYVKDNTENSMTQGKKIVVPVTVLECPPMKIFSVRFYKKGMVVTEVLAENLDKELKKKVKIPKENKKNFEQKLHDLKEYEDIRVICYSKTQKTRLKKTPDLNEIALSGNIEEKLKFVKENIGKEILVSNVFQGGQVVDLRGLTKGKGFAGPVKRFGISLKAHKTEKGVRRPGTLGPWHPARVTFRVAMAGQLGLFSRINYNQKIIYVSANNEKLKSITNYGDIKTNYVIVSGSVQGPSKRQILMTYPSRETKKQAKKKYEFIELR